jgi:hypothetical protein
MTGEIRAAIFGVDADLVLIPLPVDERSRLALEYAAANSLPYCGLMFFVRGECSAKCEPTAEAVSTMMSAAPAFARYVHTRTKSAAAMYRHEAWKELR